MMKKNIIIIFLTIIILIILILLMFFYNTEKNYIKYRNIDNLYNSKTYRELAYHNNILNKDMIEVHIKNQTDLDNYLIETGNDITGDMVWFENKETIVFPIGTYIINNKLVTDKYNNEVEVATTDFYFNATTGNIDFNNATFLVSKKGRIMFTSIGDHNNATFKNLNVYGSTDPKVGNTNDGYYHSGRNITRVGTTKKCLSDNLYCAQNENQGLYFEMLRSKNLNIENFTTNNAHMDNAHVFDVLGSENINFKNCTNRGYLNDLTQEELLILWEKSGHNIMSEFIQMDISRNSAMGYNKFLSEDFQNLFNEYKNAGHFNDGTASKNSTIDNCRSVSFYGYLGDSIINNTYIKVNKPFASTNGSHSVYNETYTNISLTNNYFENVIHVDGTRHRHTAPIHFRIRSSADEISNSLKEEQFNLFNIVTSNTTYVNCFSNFNYAKTSKLNGSDYYIDPVGKENDSDIKNEVNSIILIDNESNNIIKTYNEYIGEEPFFDNYVFVNSSYDITTKVLTRYYRKTVEEIYEDSIEINKDLNGNIISQTSNYELDRTEVETTTERLVNNDVIKVNHTIKYYKEKDYTIIYNLDGGSSYANPISYNAKTSTFKLNNPTKKGYEFLGWTGTNLSDLTLNVIIEKGTIGDLNFIAHYKPKQYKISFIDGSNIDTKYLDYDSIIDIPIVKKQGYNFIGWYDKDNNKLLENTKVIDKDINYISKYEPIKYKIIYHSNFDNNQVINNFEYDEVIKIINNPFNNNGYKFKYWNTKKDDTGKIYNVDDIINNLPDKDNYIINLYAIWDKDNVLVENTKLNNLLIKLILPLIVIITGLFIIINIKNDVKRM